MKVDAHRLEDRLGPNEPPYRSRGEAQVGRLLDRYGIPFFYEKPTLVYDRGRYKVWRPDFTLPTYNGLIVEYAGMPDIPDYMAGVRRKKSVYRANGMPALFIYPKDISGYRWPQKVMTRIADTASAYCQPKRYPATSAVRSFSRPYGRARGYRR